MKTLVKMHLALHQFVDNYFGEVEATHWDKFCRWCDRYEDMLLSLTYPNLSKAQRDEIIELAMEGETAESILEKLGLEDREEEFKKYAKILNELEVDQWERFRVEENIRAYHPQIVDDYCSTYEIYDAALHLIDMA